MAISLIGAHQTWDGSTLSPPQKERFAASLGVMGPRPAECVQFSTTVLGATGKQRGWSPQVIPDGSRVLFCGHIDNRHELRRELELGEVDDETLYAAAYAAWGKAADLRVLGQFASIIVVPNGNDLILTRSPIAAPPLLFWHCHKKLIASSLPNAIFATGEVERRADRQKIADELFGNPYSAGQSYFAGVHRVPCGHRAVATSDGVVLQPYYSLSSLPQIHLKNDRDYVAAARELLAEGVRSALDGFSKPAISLSGGYDSQAVAALMSQSRPGRSIEAFTSIPEPGWDGVAHHSGFADEQPYVEALAAMYPEIRPHWVDAAGLNLDHKQSSVFALSGSPGPSVLGPWTHEIFGGARDAGCDVMFEAVAGNSSFSFGRHGVLAGMARRGRWLRLWKEAGYFGREQKRSRLHVLVVEALLPFAPDWAYLALARQLRPHLTPDPFAGACPLDRAFAVRVGVERRARAAGWRPDRMRTSGRRTRIEWLSFGLDCGSEAQQAFGLLYGMEVRDPTGYRPLVEFCLGIPDDQYVRDGQSRWLARRILQGLVPRLTIDETRRGLRAADWHLRLGRQREGLIAELDHLSGNPELADMIDLASLRQILTDWPEKTPPMGQDQRVKYALLNGVMAARLIRFIDGMN